MGESDTSQAANFIASKVAHAKKMGHEFIQFEALRRGGNSPKDWTRARIAGGRPSLWGRCIGAGRMVGYWRYDVRVEDAEKWLAGNRHEASKEGK